jgi:hypothetical protein
MRAGLVSKVVADRFVEALRKLEEDRDVGALVEIHIEDCDVGNVAERLLGPRRPARVLDELPRHLRRRCGPRWKHFSKSSESLATSIEPVRHRRWFLGRS